MYGRGEMQQSPLLSTKIKSLPYFKNKQTYFSQFKLFLLHFLVLLVCDSSPRAVKRRSSRLRLDGNKDRFLIVYKRQSLSVYICLCRPAYISDIYMYVYFTRAEKLKLGLHKKKINKWKRLAISEILKNSVGHSQRLSLTRQTAGAENKSE